MIYSVYWGFVFFFFFFFENLWVCFTVYHLLGCFFVYIGFALRLGLMLGFFVGLLYYNFFFSDFSSKFFWAFFFFFYLRVFLVLLKSVPHFFFKDKQIK